MINISVIGSSGWGEAPDQLRAPTKELARSADDVLIGESKVEFGESQTIQLSCAVNPVL